MKLRLNYLEKKHTALHLYGGGNIMILACFAASGPGQLRIIEGKMNSQVYQTILQDNVRMGVCSPCLMLSTYARGSVERSQNRAIPPNTNCR
uniref:Uncharacterized protein n=1 Tax=Sander lucioperca TaxID=283035 RepID=A0A8C9ZIR6_SANLU